MPNVETLRELTADELDIVAGDFFLETEVGNHGSESLNTLTGPNHILDVAGSRDPGLTVVSIHVSNNGGAGIDVSHPPVLQRLVVG
jgi:hypothetical protein